MIAKTKDLFNGEARVKNRIAQELFSGLTIGPYDYRVLATQRDY